MNQAVPASTIVVDPVDDLSPWWPRPLPAAVEKKVETEDKALVRLLFDALLVLKVNNYPTPLNIEAAKAWRPAAASLIDHWAEVWKRSFPDGLEGIVSAKHVNEGPLDHYAQYYVENEEREVAAFAKGDLSAAAVSRYWKMVRDEVEVGGERSWQAHVVDDAECMWALREAVPGDTWISLRDQLFRLERHDPDGVPIVALQQGMSGINFSTALAGALKANRMSDDDPYWNSPAFLAMAGRKFAVARNAHEISIVLAAMAREGRRKAFLKGVESKSGTWTVDISEVRTVKDASAALYRAIMPWTFSSKGVMVQEHLPFTHEQRFFVLDGRIVASVCSDRHLCATDKNPARILDERIAVLTHPEGDVGNYDRGHTTTVVDRGMAAAFARCARKVAAGLASEGIRNYVVDIGMTSRGCVPIELNSLYMSGPYCLDRTRFVRAKLRSREKALLELRRRFSAIAERTSMDEDVPDIAAAALARLDGIAGFVSKIVSMRPGTPALGSRTSSVHYGIHAETLDRMTEDAAKSIREERKAAAKDVVGKASVSRIPVDPLEIVAGAILPGCPILFSFPVELGATSGRLVVAPLPSPRGATMRGEWHLGVGVAVLDEGGCTALPLNFGRRGVGVGLERVDDLVELLHQDTGWEDGEFVVHSAATGAGIVLKRVAYASSCSIVVRSRSAWREAWQSTEIGVPHGKIPVLADWKPTSKGPEVFGSMSLMAEKDLEAIVREISASSVPESMPDDVLDIDDGWGAISKSDDGSQEASGFDAVSPELPVGQSDGSMPVPIEESLCPDPTRDFDALAFSKLPGIQPLFSVPFAYAVRNKTWRGRLCGGRLPGDAEPARIAISASATDGEIHVAFPVDYKGTRSFPGKVVDELHDRIIGEHDSGFDFGRFPVKQDEGFVLFGMPLGLKARLRWIGGPGAVVAVELAKDGAILAKREFPAGSAKVPVVVTLNTGGEPWAWDSIDGRG